MGIVTCAAELLCTYQKGIMFKKGKNESNINRLNLRIDEDVRKEAEQALKEHVYWQNERKKLSKRLIKL